MKERTRLEGAINTIKRLRAAVDDNDGLIEMAEAEKDEAMIADAERALAEARAEAAKARLETLLSGEADANNAYVEINSGAGGTEAQDWAEMLARMYTRWAERRGFKVSWLEESAGEEAGIKSCAFKVEGPNAYGWLKTELGVHRLVRISPFDGNARRQTSFASVWVYPEVDDNIEIELIDKELRVDTYRASGSGGQHVNKTDFGGAHHPSSHRHRRRGAAGTQPAPESRQGDPDAEGAPLRARIAEARGRAPGGRGQQDRHRLGPPDPLVRAAALSDGEGPAHER